MLPSSTPARRSLGRRDSNILVPSTRPSLISSIFGFLRERSRPTNLSALLVLLSLVVSLYFNVRSNFVGAAPVDVPISIIKSLQSPHSNLIHLIMVPGHAIWAGCDASRATTDQDWILEPMQRGGSVKTFVRHISKAVELAVNDPLALLIYSGGQTRPNTEISEATSYARLASAGNLYNSLSKNLPDSSKNEFQRVTTEEFALDSFENVLFSIARFKEFTGNFPTRITIVGFGMKRRRYEDVHRAAVRWPTTAFKYIGIDNESQKGEDYDGERKGGLEPFVKDSYGCSGVLQAKKRKRNVNRRYHSYHSSVPELSALFEYCPTDNSLFSKDLPWD